MADEFKQIHSLIREGRADDALMRLYDHDRSEIRSPYDSNLNHAWYVVGDVFYKRAEFDAALKAFLRACDERPDDADALMAAGNCYSELGLFKDAENYSRKALDAGEPNDNLKYNLACSLFDQEKYRECIEFYKAIGNAAGPVYRLARRNLRNAENRIRGAQHPKQRMKGRKHTRPS